MLAHNLGGERPKRCPFFLPYSFACQQLLVCVFVSDCMPLSCCNCLLIEWVFIRCLLFTTERRGGLLFPKMSVSKCNLG